MSAYYQNFIGGHWRDGAGGERIAVENPATGEQLAEVARATPADVDAAVGAARRCVEDRSLVGLKPADRGRYLVDMGRWIVDHRGEIAELLTLDSGKTLQESGWEVDGCAGYLEYYGGLAPMVEGSYIPVGDGIVDYAIPVPYGVSAHIIPWNYPLDIVGRGIGPAIATGNAVVVKSPELDPITVTYVARAAEEVGLPPGALNVIAGYGHDAGDALSKHPDVDQITFTGSVETGQKVLHAAADAVIPTVVELGGKSAAIVLPDADLDVLTEQTRWGIYSNAGQVCSAMSRLVVPHDLRDEIVDRVVARSEELTVGPGIDGNDMGSLISAQQLERVDRYVRTAQEDGVTVATGGGRLDRPGHFYQPTVLVGVENGMTIAQEEVFGPVLSVISYTHEAEALAIANDSQYGLVSGVFGNDLDRVTYLADRLEAGQVFVNEWFLPGREAPFGGFKKSGFGREKGLLGLRSYYHWKNVGIRRT